MSLAALYQNLLDGPAWLNTLALSARAQQAREDIWFWLVVLVVLSCLVIAAGLVVRKLYADPSGEPDANATFDLSELRRLHRAGELTDAEYQAARSIALKDAEGYLDRSKASAERPSEVTPPATPTAPPPAEETPANPDDIELGPELLEPDSRHPGPDEPDKSDRGPGPPDRTPRK